MASRVDVVLQTLPQELSVIQTKYARSLTNREMSDELLHDIARFLEDCQRALDWTATDIDRTYGKASDRSPYYPLCDSPRAFKHAMCEHFPKVPQAVYDAMERHQPYQPGKTCLGYLHDLARVNKHQDFTPQTRTERRAIRVSSGAAVVEWDSGAVTFGNGVYIAGVPVDPRTQRPVPSPEQEVVEVLYVGWDFVNPNVPVLPTLESLARLIPEAVAEVRHAVGI